MSTGPVLDHFWVFAAGVAFAPVLGSAAVAALVRWRAGRREYAVEVRRGVLFGLVLFLFVLMPAGGGAVLGPLHGIPPGLGVVGTLLFLLAVYFTPVALGAFAFTRFVSRRLSPRDEETTSGSANPDGWGVIAETGPWFVGVHLALFPALYALAVLAS